MSFDIETPGGAGIVQMSAEAVQLQLVQGTSAGKDSATSVSRMASTFNKYVNPGRDAVWDAVGTSVHGLHSTHPNIVEASDMATVWAQFRTWIDEILLPGEVIVVVAYNGASCDLKWLWTLTQAPDSPFDLPDSFGYFLDPYRVIAKMSSCKLNPEKSKLDSLLLGVVWKYINDGENLNGAHDSLVDVKAQTDILVHPYFVPFIDWSISIKLISEIFTKTEQNNMKKNMEPTRPVHRPWHNESNDVTWAPSQKDSYDGPNGSTNAPSEPDNECDENHDYASESAAATSKIRTDKNSALKDATGHEKDHLPSKSAGETHQTAPVDDPASEDSGIDFASSKTRKMHPSSKLDANSNSQIAPISSKLITEIDQIDPNNNAPLEVGRDLPPNQLGQQRMDIDHVQIGRAICTWSMSYGH